VYGVIKADVKKKKVSLFKCPQPTGRSWVAVNVCIMCSLASIGTIIAKLRKKLPATAHFTSARTLKLECCAHESVPNQRRDKENGKRPHYKFTIVRSRECDFDSSL